MGKGQEPLVSICCITYNHEKYIRDAIESFLMQKTDFPFEIIIHDDASTDMTANIIKEYENKYPKYIKPIYQTENQYSKGIKPSTIVFNAAKGRYLAICEGDDYWTDSQKLQKQIESLENNPKCHISFHPAIMKWEDGSEKKQIICQHSYKSKIFSIHEVIKGGGGFMPTNSIVIHKSAAPKIISFFKENDKLPAGDYYMQLLAAENGGALYLKEIMSVYRTNVKGSWSERNRDQSQNMTLLVNSTIKSIDKIDAFTNNKYSSSFAEKKRTFISTTLKSTAIDIKTRDEIFKSYTNLISSKDKIIWYGIYKNEKLIRMLKKIKETMNPN